MLIVLSGGGTAGHINPALALAEELEKRGCTVRFAGTPTGVESRLVPAAGIEFKAFEAQGFDRSHPLTLPKAVMKIQKSTGEAKRWFDEIQPDAVVGFGGYVCIPVARAAEQRDIPVVVHEQNSVMGMANKYLAKRAAAVCLTYERAAEALSDKSRVKVTGNPVRSSVFGATRAEGRAAFGVPDDARMLLVTGGSLGARHLNQAVTALKDALLSYEDLHVVHVTGPKELDAVTDALSLSEVEARRWHLYGYTDQMGLAMAAADAIVSRAGATSLAEISARALPALLVPFPYATEDHQTMNARACVDAGAAFMVADADVEGPEFERLLRTLVEDADVRERMACAARAQKTKDAAALLADAVMQAASSRGSKDAR
ncbi:undecaprenyldiphospho-muramoylpentapeptide beta-N-acetylglucosaminyltransferase [Paraeggerthella hongkongensis]|uniref:undecaprenyldiphospho-muramoylpentapeptide beta-N-acetylglucosaminyltransferase n=1 Tax=Paraeggerthella TaxID=651554 RepID=UPI000DF8569D|nr:MULTISPECIES: undecaprenyldiphospho-muramoylpentapeptide beta-N-acetylglucosaminyltransferase [Paraeggerthella]MBU5405802.1 undecaprenyldiphospho-muramoylpentapeptide beta-N-acetylglucosaminyltransferase [Paraeggerthella hongkongensis]MCD2433649.1 undecaprenyldiphospho-muramoylpentapeptide beta-N-acetylglucosaminyltransferase [Paraeggerthella hominis]RDB57150.1 undecaprenyldiphospho-muramoylpentapeptide beta-N-acetylglucosaminyltransferase [Paraeggerthella hongkongensis]